MKYNELKEMKIEDWDGQPFEAYYTDNPLVRVDGVITEIVGYIDGKWTDGPKWNHVYPVKWNKDKVDEYLNPKPKRMTNRQLAMWLAKGNGQMLYASHIDLSIERSATTRVCHPYDLCYDADECSSRVRVRKWDSEEWIEPTVDLLEE